MAQATLNVRMDEELKRDFAKICDDLGLTMSTAITMLAKLMTKQKYLPFEPYLDPFYSESNLAELRRIIADKDNGKGVRVTLEELDRMLDEQPDDQ